MARGAALALQRRGSATTANAAFVLNLLFLSAVAGFGCWLVGTRGLDIGTDTSTYAAFFERFDAGPVDTRMEPGFVFVTWLLSRLGLGVAGYQGVLFALLLGTVCLSTRRYFEYLGGQRGYLTFLGASVMLLYLSPMFVNGAINAVRQGLAALLVFAALLAFQQRRWAPFAVLGAVAASMHYSALLYLAFAPALLLPPRVLRYVAAAAFLAYCTGLTLLAVQALAPPLYAAVMSYSVDPDYRSGVRIDFAVFSAFWYVLPLALAPWVHAPYRERLKASTGVYLVMLLPFFCIGWAYYSNRYLLPAWLAVSLMLAAMLVFSRFAPLRSPLLIRAGLVAACGVFYVLVTNVIVI